jgi:predicted nucleic acid-binding Zn ribbon protein
MQFDSFQSIVDPPLQHCPSCHGEIQRVITGGTGLIFKGSGFYITDYSKKKDSKKSTSDSSQKKDGKKKSKDSDK